MALDAGWFVHVADGKNALTDAAADLHTRIYVFVHHMESLAGKPEGTFESNAAFYAEAEGATSTLRLRARVQEKNDLTVKQIQELGENLGRLRQLHETEHYRRASDRAQVAAIFQAIATAE